MILLAILDGWGYSNSKIGNAIYYAHTPNFDEYMARYPHTLLEASGEAVGLPAGQMGNSEVGHLNIGAGRIVYQESMKILKAIEDGSFFENKVLKEAMEKAKKSKLHLMGLIGDGGVHAMMEHLYALLEMAKEMGVKEVYIHCFLDGRDTPPKSAIKHIRQLEEKIGEIGIGEIASLIGRYFAMDRDKKWDRTKKAYDMLVKGRRRLVKNAEEGIKIAYENGETDEFIQPTVIEGKSRIENGDVVIFFNFRPDRARQLTEAFIRDDFHAFPRLPLKVHFVTLTQYDDSFNTPAAFKAEKIKNTLGEVLARHKLKQLRIAETEKYAHVTYFFNGGEEKPFEGEDRCLIPSPKVATYDLKPEMSAYEVTEEVIRRIESRKYDFIVLNYANPDMVGHTGIWKAILKALEVVDECIGKVVDAVMKQDGIAIVTSDHGNAEEMLEDGMPKTAHTTNPVPFILIGADENLRKGNLGDIAPTILEFLDIEKPEEMSGRSLMRKFLNFS
ncbi:MAG: 2,3-bisphosphoglycerate-independent phosphoglycerate mutase [Thermoplasmata archaeon]|nr:MAG: 2,3-bisphosphoglycerate-independent phosphoglycerate mutase [Thermoplasmata archaeon]